MDKTIWTLHQETMRIVWKGIKNNVVQYVLLLSIALTAMATILLAPFAVKFLIGMHEMLIADGKIDYRKLLSQVDEDKNYFKVLLILTLEASIVAGGLALFVVPGVLLALALVPVNYYLYKGMTPKISVIIPASIDLMKGKKLNLFLALLLMMGVYFVVYGVLMALLFLLGNITPILMLPILILVADIIGVFGGYLVSIHKLGFAPGPYITSTFDFLKMIDVTSGLTKAAAFGFIIALMGCYHGYYSKGGAQGVGAATTNAVVSSSILILLSNYYLTAVFFGS